MRRLLSMTVTAILLVSLAGCGDDEADPLATTTVADAATTGATPFHAIPTDAVGVTGTAICDFSGTDASFRVVCELDLTDPRVSGTETTDHYRFYPTGEVAGVWVAQAAITTENGTWRGITQAADDSTPCGEAHYTGEGTYEGLEFHYYFCHVADPAQLRGWISGGG